MFDTCTLAALNLRASSGLSPVASATGSKARISIESSIPNTSLMSSSLSPALTSVEIGDITLADDGALKTVVTAAPVDRSTV